MNQQLSPAIPQHTHQDYYSLTTINSFPPELLSDILALGSGHLDSHLTFDCANLRMFSLVCKTWTKVAQPLLWKKLAIFSDVKIGRHSCPAIPLLNSPKFGSYILDGVRGIRFLYLFAFDGPRNRLDLSCFRSSSLAGLTTLRLSETTVDFHDEQYVGRLPLTRTLRYLILDDYSSTSNSLYSLFEGPALTRLSISQSHSFQTSAFQHFFSSVAHQLTHLTINSDVPVPISPFSLCSNLSSLEISCSPPDILAIAEVLPVKLTTFTLWPPVFFETLADYHRDLLSCIQENSMKYLKTFRFGSVFRDFEEPEGIEIVTALDRNGTMVEFDAENNAGIC